MFTQFDYLFSQVDNLLDRAFENQNKIFNQSNWDGRKIVHSYKVPSENTSVLVGNTPITARGARNSPHLLQEFLRKLLHREIDRKLSCEKVIQNLIGAKELVDSAVNSHNKLKTCINQILNFKSELRLKDRTDLVISQLKKVEYLLESIEYLTIPEELTKESVTEFITEVDAFVEKTNHDLAIMQNTMQQSVRDIVQHTTRVAQNSLIPALEEPEFVQEVAVPAHDYFKQTTEQYKKALCDTLRSYAEDAECTQNMIPHLLEVRSQVWDNLHLRGLQCRTSDETEKWNLSVHNELEVEKEIYAQINQAILNASRSNLANIGPVAIAQSLITQIGSEGRYFLNKIASHVGSEADKLQTKFAAIVKSPALTLDELERLIQETGNAVLQWSEQQKIETELFKEWLSTLDQLSTKTRTVRNFLLADAQDNKVFFEELEAERRDFHQRQFTFIDKQYDDMIGMMKEVHPFYPDRDRLNTLDTYLVNWNKAFTQIEPKRELFKMVLNTESKLTTVLEAAQHKMIDWQAKYQLVIKDKLADLIQRLQADINKKKTVISSIKHVENFIRLMHESSEQIEKFIQNVKEMPLPEVIEAYAKKEEIANEVREHFIQSMRKKLNACHIELDILRRKFSDEPGAEAFVKTILHQANVLAVYSKTHDVLVDPMSGETEPVPLEQLNTSQLKDYQQKVSEVILVAKAEARRAAAKANLDIAL